MQAVQLRYLVRKLRPHMSSGQKQNKTKQNTTLEQKQYCNKFNKDFKNGPHELKKKRNLL